MTSVTLYNITRINSEHDRSKTLLTDAGGFTQSVTVPYFKNHSFLCVLCFLFHLCESFCCFSVLCSCVESFLCLSCQTSLRNVNNDYCIHVLIGTSNLYCLHGNIWFPVGFNILPCVEYMIEWWKLGFFKLNIEEENISCCHWINTFLCYVFFKVWQMG